jgi:hypothetical protein
MRKWLLITFAGLFLILTIITTTSTLLANPTLPVATPKPVFVEDGFVVRVYFEDLKTAYNIASSFEPLESNYELGYLVLSVSDTEYQQLAASGLNIEIDQEKMLQLVQPLAPGIQSIPGFSCYRTVEETFASAQALATNFPNLATWTDVGDSWEKNQGLGGYDMLVLTLTNSAIPGPKPKIFFTSAIHAREYTTAELMTRFAEELVNGYGTDPDATWILDYHEVHLMLQANPDGRKQAETGILWRKNTNQNYCSPTSNNRGADLNRNFEFEWNCCGGSSSNQCDSTYHGAGPASEPETQAVQNYIHAEFNDQRGPNVNDPAPDDATGIYIDVHSSGRLLLWPWGFTSNPAPNGTQLQTLGRKLAFFNGHEPKQSIGLYPTDGTTTSFAYGDMGLAAFTFELGTQFFESCSYFENTLLPDNLPSLWYAVKVPRTPYITPAGPEALNAALSAGSALPGVPSGTQLVLTASINDTRYNNSNGTEPTQNIAAAEYYLDTPPWEAGATAVVMSPSDGSFNSSVESAEASIDTTSFSQGQHIIFMRGQDVNGVWGAISAVFLYIDDNAPTPTATPPPPTTIFFDDFEGDLGWTANPLGTDTATTGQWERANPEETNSSGVKQLGTTVSGVNDLVTGPLAGSSVGTHDIDNGETSIRSPNILLPSSGDLELSFYYYLAHLNNATTDDYLRVQVVGSTTTTVFEELGAGDNDDAVWDSFSTNLNSFAGQTIYLLISAADAGSGSLIEAAIDDVHITQSGGGPTATPTSTPVPPTNTPVPPTNTPAPPTDTPPPPTDTPIPPPTDTPAPPTDTPIPPTATNTPVPTDTPVPGNDPIIYVSSTSGGNAGGVSFADEDILAFDTATGTWSLVIDGSDIGLSGSSSRDVNAFAKLPDGSFLFSFVGATTIPDVGSVDDSDIVRFIPTSTGNTTAGTFEWYFDGSDVGLTTNGEDIDGLALASNGDLIISTIGSHSVTGASGNDEDLIRFSPTSLGSSTSGTWTPYFDGSDVGLSTSSSEDVYGVWIDNNGDIYLSTSGSFSVTGASGDGADIFTCVPGSTGSNTSCTFSFYWDGSAYGYGGETMDGLHIETP